MKKTIIWTAIVCCSFATAVAQTPADKAVQSWSFSLDQARQFALDHNRNRQKMGLAVKEAQAAEWAALANYLPQTNASVSYTNYMGAELNIMGMAIPMKSASTFTFQASQALFNANIIVGIQLAKLGRQMSEKAVEQTDLSIKNNVNIAYYSILVSEDNKKILEKNLANVKVLAKATHDKVNVGIGEQTEADQMDVTVANLENTLQTTDRTIEMAYNSLRLLLGVGVNDELKLTDTLDQLTGKRNSFELLATPFNVTNNTDMQLSNLNQALAEKQLKSTYASLLPSLSAAYQHSEKLVSSNFDMTMKNVLVLTASVPLFTSGKNSANVKKARFAVESAQLDNQLAKDQLLIQEKQLRYNLNSAQAAYDIQKKNIEVSQRVFDNITKKYEQGLSSSLELTTANNNLLTAQSNYIGSVLSLLQAQDALLKLLGAL